MEALVMVLIGIAVHGLFAFSIWRYRTRARRAEGTRPRTFLPGIGAILVTLFWVAFAMHYWN
jgi:heme/copper-type cytochrome/quinol oxidase subunit 2